MKRILFHRKTILRAIQAACLALFLAATTAARAQTATGSNGNVTISGSGAQYVYNGTNPTLSPTGTLVISSGSIISNTSPNSVIIGIGQGAAVTNNGALSVNYSGGPNTVTPISYTTSSGQAVTITNSGSLSGITPDNTSTGAGLYFKNSGAGAVTVNNSGSAYGSGHLGYGLYTSTLNGAITITNSAYSIHAGRDRGAVERSISSRPDGGKAGWSRPYTGRMGCGDRDDEPYPSFRHPRGHPARNLCVMCAKKGASEVKEGCPRRESKPLR